MEDIRYKRCMVTLRQILKKNYCFKCKVKMLSCGKNNEKRVYECSKCGKISEKKNHNADTLK